MRLPWGWSGNEQGTPENFAIPTMRDLYEKIAALFEIKDYSGEVKSNLKTALEVRIGSLLRRGVGTMLNTQKSSPTIADLLKHPTILELDYLNQDQANLITFFLLTKIREYIKRQRTEGSGIPEHIILLEEAHNLVGRNLSATAADDANTKQEAANYITRMLAEMRALREAIIIADQLPTGVAAEVVKNTNIKIAHRLVSGDDRKDIGQAMLLNQSQMEEIARLNTGESFLYMEGWYRPHMVKIPYENSAKLKLGIENSITNNKITALIKPYSWYSKTQKTLLTTAYQEYKRLCKEYQQSITEIRSHLQQLADACSQLQQQLQELTQEIFYVLAGELRFVLHPIPESEVSLKIDRRIDSRKLHNLNNLQPAKNLTLRELLELQSAIATKFTLFEQHYQEVIDIDINIPRTKYKQQWQKLDRQLKTLHQQVFRIATLFKKPEFAKTLEQLKEEIDYEKRQIVEKEEEQTKNVLKNIQKDRKELQFKQTEVLNRAIEKAKIDKVMHDLQIRGK